MAFRTKEELETEIQMRFPDNTQGLITPLVTRGFYQDMVDSLIGLRSYGFFFVENSSALTEISTVDTWTQVAGIPVVFGENFEQFGGGARYTGIRALTCLLQVNVNFTSEQNNREFRFKMFQNVSALPGQAFVQASNSVELQGSFCTFTTLNTNDVLTLQVKNLNNATNITAHDVTAALIGQF